MLKTYEHPVDILEFDAETRTLSLRIVPYGPIIRHWGVRQKYTRVDIPEGKTIAFTASHPTSIRDIVGKLISHEQKDDGLYGDVQLVDTASADEVYTLAKAGLVNDVSAGVIVDSDDYDEDTDLHVRTGHLDHIAGVLRGAFGDTEPGSKVLAVHSHDQGENTVDNDTDTDTQDEVVGLTRDDVLDIVDLSTIEDEVRQLRQTIELGRTDTPVTPTIEAYEWFAAQIQADPYFNNHSPLEKLLEEFALDGTTGVSGGSGAAEGLMPADWWAAGLIDIRGGWRPLFSRLGSMPYPKTGSSTGFPKITSGPLVGERAAQDGSANTDPLIVTAGSAAIQWFDGALRVALELIEQSDPAVMAVVWGRLVAKLNAQIENYAADTIAEGGTAQGGALDFTTYKTLVTDLVTTSELIRVATDEPGNLLGCSTSDWIEVVTMMDGNGRRQFASINPENADGTMGILAQSVVIGESVLAFHVPDLAESMQFNTAAAKGNDKGPRRLQSLDVEKVGVNVGILGSAIIAPMIQGGIYYYAAAVPS